MSFDTKMIFDFHPQQTIFHEKHSLYPSHKLINLSQQSSLLKLGAIYVRHAILKVDTWPALLLAIHSRLHCKVVKESKKRGQIVNESNFVSDFEMVPKRCLLIFI